MFSSTEFSSNGIRFSSLQSNKFKASVLVFSITVPLLPQHSINNRLICGLLRRGSRSLPSMSAINKSLDELYGSCVEIRNSKKGNNLSLIITAEVLDNKFIPDGADALGGVIDIVSELLLFPHFCDADFCEDFFEQEKKLLEDVVLTIKNNTSNFAIKRCSELMGEGVSQSPTIEASLGLIRNTEFNSVLSYYNDIILRSPIDVFYVGASEPQAIKEKLFNAFSGKITTLAQEKMALEAYKRKSFCSITEKLPVSQGKLALGFSTKAILSSNDDTYYTALVFNEIFGGSASSKLFLNVREKMSLCYFCSSTYSLYTGMVLVSCGIEVNKREIAKEAILGQLQDIRNGNISEFELDSARKSLLNGYRQIYDNPLDIYGFYSGRRFFDINDGIEECCSSIMKVTPEQIKDFAVALSLDAEFFVEGTKAGEAQEEDFENDQ